MCGSIYGIDLLIFLAERKRSECMYDASYCIMRLWQKMPMHELVCSKNGDDIFNTVSNRKKNLNSKSPFQIFFPDLKKIIREENLLMILSRKNKFRWRQPRANVVQKYAGSIAYAAIRIDWSNYVLVSNFEVVGPN